MFSIGSLDLLLGKIIHCKCSYSIPHRHNLTSVSIKHLQSSIMILVVDLQKTQQIIRSAF